MHAHRMGVLDIGSHALTDLDFAQTVLSGTVLLIVQANIRRHGGAIIHVGLDDLTYAVEPLGVEFGEDRHEVVLRNEVPADLSEAILQSSEPAARLAQMHGCTVVAINELRAANEHVAVQHDGKRLSPEIREIIRQSSEPTSVLTARYGISRQAISALRNYQPTKVRPTITPEMLDIIRSDRPIRQIMRLTGLTAHYVRKARVDLAEA